MQVWKKAQKQGSITKGQEEIQVMTTFHTIVYFVYYSKVECSNGIKFESPPIPNNAPFFLCFFHPYHQKSFLVYMHIRIIMCVKIYHLHLQCTKFLNVQLCMCICTLSVKPCMCTCTCIVLHINFMIHLSLCSLYSKYRGVMHIKTLASVLPSILKG